MIRFDKMKIVSSIDFVEILDYSKFECKVKDDCISEYRFSILSPYLLYVEVDYLEQELVLEFTGKILGDDYPQLINKDTIRQCLDHINQLRFCNLNIDAILSYGDVVKADVCCDVDYPDTQELSQLVRSSIGNFKKYLAREVGGNLILEKNVLTKSCQRRLTIYNKELELQRACNRKFLELVGDCDRLLDNFKGKTRFELNLNSKEQLRKVLCISDTSIESVLSSDANPIWEMLDKALVDVGDAGVCHNLNELKNLLLLQHCGGDLAKVEGLLRQHLSPKTHISKVLKPYRQLVEKLSNADKISIKDTLRNILLEITILLGIFI